MGKLEALRTNTTFRHYVRVVAFVVFGVSCVVLFSYQLYPHLKEMWYVEYVYEHDDDNKTTTTEEATNTTASGMVRSLPTKLNIPALSITAEFEEPLQLNEDKSVEVPESFEKVGWYGLGVSPGEVGPAVILGHVDSYEGPAVFFSLGQLKQDDEIRVERADGSTAVFAVDYFERYPIDEFPTEKVYGETTGPELRLITCTGIYDHGTRRYSHNLVVYAKLVAEPL